MATVAQRTEKATDGAPPSPDQLLVDRYHAAVARLAAGQRPEAKTGLDKALATKLEVRTGVQAEVAAFLTWLGGPAPAPAALGFQKGDDRWAAFVWREALDEGEFEVRGRFSLAATGWRAILQQVQQRYPDAWPADYVLARAYAAGGASTEALALLAHAVNARKDWWAPCFAMGQYYAKQRDKENGIPILQKTLELAPQCRAARGYLALLTTVKPDEGDE